MRGGTFPPALVCAALGLSLGFALPRARGIAIGVLVVAGGLAYGLRLGSAWPDAVFMACWVAVVGAAAAMHLPGGIGLRLAVLLALAAGLCAGAVVAVSGEPRDLALAVLFALLSFPAGWLVTTNRAIVVKVAGSWLIAIATLAAGLSFVPTPGYVPDHMD